MTTQLSMVSRLNFPGKKIIINYDENVTTRKVTLTNIASSKSAQKKNFVQVN
jgi:hypothetical protein